MKLAGNNNNNNYKQYQVNCRPLLSLHQRSIRAETVLSLMVNKCDPSIRLAAALALPWADSHSRACEINADSSRFKIASVLVHPLPARESLPPSLAISITDACCCRRSHLHCSPFLLPRLLQ
jgi:hypothetical protein